MRVKAETALRFTSLKLVNWRNFRTVDVNLQKRAFFVGPNASGKSNLLDAVRFLSDIARPGSGGLQAAIESRGGLSSIRCLHARTTPNVEIEVTIGNDQNEQRWRYVLKININKSERIPTIVSEIIYRDKRRIKSQVRRANSDPLEYSQTLIEQVRSEFIRERVEWPRPTWFQRVARPDLEQPCGPRPPGGSIAAKAYDTKPI